MIERKAGVLLFEYVVSAKMETLLYDMVLFDSDFISHLVVASVSKEFESVSKPRSV